MPPKKSFMSFFNDALFGRYTQENTAWENHQASLYDKNSYKTIDPRNSMSWWQKMSDNLFGTGYETRLTQDWIQKSTVENNQFAPVAADILRESGQNPDLAPGILSAAGGEQQDTTGLQSDDDMVASFLQSMPSMITSGLAIIQGIQQMSIARQESDLQVLASFGGVDGLAMAYYNDLSDFEKAQTHTAAGVAKSEAFKSLFRYMRSPASKELYPELIARHANSNAFRARQEQIAADKAKAVVSQGESYASVYNPLGASTEEQCFKLLSGINELQNEIMILQSTLDKITARNGVDTQTFNWQVNQQLYQDIGYRQNTVGYARNTAGYNNLASKRQYQALQGMVKLGAKFASGKDIASQLLYNYFLSSTPEQFRDHVIKAVTSMLSHPVGVATLGGTVAGSYLFGRDEQGKSYYSSLRSQSKAASQRFPEKITREHFEALSAEDKKMYFISHTGFKH